MLFEGSGKFVDVGQIRAGELGLGTMILVAMIAAKPDTKSRADLGVKMLGVFVCCACSKLNAFTINITC